MKRLDPIKTALIVIDMQNDFYADGYSAVLRGKPVVRMQALPARMNAFASDLRESGAKVIFTKFISDPVNSPANYLETLGEGRANPMCKVGTAGAEFAGVDAREEDTVIEKPYYDSFAKTNLLRLLKDQHIENVIIAGVRTEICVLATAGRSYSEGFRTFVVSDLVGTYDDKEDIADTALDIMKYYGFVLDSGVVKALLA